MWGSGALRSCLQGASLGLGKGLLSSRGQHSLTWWSSGLGASTDPCHEGMGSPAQASWGVALTLTPSPGWSEGGSDTLAPKDWAGHRPVMGEGRWGLRGRLPRSRPDLKPQHWAHPTPACGAESPGMAAGTLMGPLSTTHHPGPCSTPGSPGEGRARPRQTHRWS